MGTVDAYSPEEMIDAFIMEKEDFRPGTFPNVTTGKDWTEIGHYTQLIWPATREVGCAVAKDSNYDVLVCRYWPAGNVIGSRVP